MKNPAILIDPLHDIDLKEGKFEKTTAADIRRAFANLKEHGPSRHLCVFFHGGLVSEADGLKTADQLLRNYTSSGAYPFFFIWQSDLITTVAAKLEHYSDDPGFVSAVNHTVRAVALKLTVALDTDRSLMSRRPSTKVRKPPAMSLKELAAFSKPFDTAWDKRTGAQLACSGSELDQFAQWLTAAGKSVPRKRPLFPVKRLRGLQNPLARIIRRLNSGHGHGVYTTVVEELLIAAGVADELGAPIWEEMKRFIENSFSNDATAGCTTFLNHLCEAWQENPTLRVTLIGHSAGAIYVQRFIEALDAQLAASSTLQVEVILLAAAITFERMNAGLPALYRRVSKLRVFGLDSKTEGSYWEVPPIYNKSLLYIVSSLCEADPNADKPLVGMQRYTSNSAPYTDPDIRAVLEFIQRTRTVWSPTTSDAKMGYRSQARRHASFPLDTETNSSVCFMLQSGF
jgi:hypothetical protein